MTTQPNKNTFLDAITQAAQTAEKGDDNELARQLRAVAELAATHKVGQINAAAIAEHLARPVEHVDFELVSPFITAATQGRTYPAPSNKPDQNAPHYG